MARQWNLTAISAKITPPNVCVWIDKLTQITNFYDILCLLDFNAFFSFHPPSRARWSQFIKEQPKPKQVCEAINFTETESGVTRRTS